jgi:uncharacterized protein (TIGR00255 family)
LRTSLGIEEEISPHHILQAEGVLRLAERPAALESARKALREASEVALAQLVAMREREGEAMKKDLTQRLGTLRTLAGAVGVEVPSALAEHRRRLLARVADLIQAPPDPGRIEQEIALLAERTDIAEELTRFESHLGQFAELLATDAPVGRRLDFLSQELHREVTTIGNKSQSAAIARLVIELKAETERIREQAQNVE